MVFNIKMFDKNSDIVVVHSSGYESILKHSHDFVEIIYIENGKGIHNVGGAESIVNAGDLIVLLGDEEHNLTPLSKESEFIVKNIIFLPENLRFDLTSLTKGQVVNVSANKTILSLMDNIEDEYNLREDEFELVCFAYLDILLTRVNRLHKNTKVSINSVKNTGLYIDMVVGYLTNHYFDKITLDSLSHEVGLSKGYIQKIFRDYRNTTVIEFLIRFRIEQACKMLLEEECTVAKISERVGFSDVKNFYTSFKKLVGRTPVEYKNLQKLKKETKNGKYCACTK